MHKPTVLLVILALLAAPLYFVRADGLEEHPINEHMEEVNSAYKLLRRQARRKNFDDNSLEHVITMQQHTLKAMHMGFPRLEAASGEKKQQMLIGFRKKMAETLKHMLDLEIALLEGRADDAAELVNQLATDKNEGHEAYTDETG